MKLLDVINPATEELITQLPIDDGAAVAIKAQKARQAQAAWRPRPWLTEWPVSNVSVLWSKHNWTTLPKS